MIGITKSLYNTWDSFLNSSHSYRMLGYVIGIFTVPILIHCLTFSLGLGTVQWALIDVYLWATFFFASIFAEDFESFHSNCWLSLQHSITMLLVIPLSLIDYHIDLLLFLLRSIIEYWCSSSPVHRIPEHKKNLPNTMPIGFYLLRKP